MFDLSRDIRSLTDFKRNTPAFLRELKQPGRAVVLTVNGRAEVVAMSAATFQSVLESLDRLDAIRGIRQGLDEAARGETSSLEEAEERLRRKLGLPADDHSKGRGRHRKDRDVDPAA